MKLIAYSLPLFAHVRNIPSEKREVASHYRRLPQAFAAGGQRERRMNQPLFGVHVAYTSRDRVTRDRPSTHPHQGAKPEKLESRSNKFFPVQIDTLPLPWCGFGLVYSNLESGWHRNVVRDGGLRCT